MMLKQRMEFSNTIDYFSLLRGIGLLVFGILLLNHNLKAVELIILFLGLWWLLKGTLKIITTLVGNSQWGGKLLGWSMGSLLLLLSGCHVGGTRYFSLRTITIGLLLLLFSLIALVTIW